MPVKNTMIYFTEMYWSAINPSCLCLRRQYKILNVPLSSHLAANHFNQQQAEQEERMRMKKLTLDINERQEQEDYQGTALLSGNLKG